MSAPSNGDKPAYIEYTAPTRKNVRRTPKPLRDIGVEQFVRPGGTPIGAGHILPGSAFDTLARKKKPLQNQGGKRVKMSQYEVGEKTGNGGKTDLKGKTGVDDKTNNPAVAPGARGDTPRQGFNATDWDESLWGEHDESIDGIKPQEARQKRNDRVLKDLRPNVAIPAPDARTLKAKAGAWGASKLAKPAKDVVNTVAHPTANKPDSIAHEAFEEKKKRQALAAKNKPTAEESYRNDRFAKRNEKAIVQVHKGKADVEYPSPSRVQPPQRKQRKRKASPPAPFFSEDDEDDIPVVPKNRPGRAKPASRIQTHDTRNNKATSALPAKTVVEQLSQDDEEDDDADDDNDDDEDDDDDDEDDMPVVLNNRRRRTRPASQFQAHDSQNEEAVGNHHSQDDEDEDNDNEDNDDEEDNDTPIVQINRRRRAQPAQPSQPNDIPNQPTTAQPLSDNAAINLLMQLGAPPTQAQALAHIPLAQFPTNTPASQPRPQPQPQPQPERQPQPQPQTPLKKGVAHPPQPKRARPATTATTNKKDTTTPSPPSKKPRVARKTEPQKPAKPATKEEEPAKAAEKPAAPAKKGVAAIKGKKGVAVKKPIPKKGRNKMKGYALVTDESGSN